MRPVPAQYIEDHAWRRFYSEHSFDQYVCEECGLFLEVDEVRCLFFWYTHPIGMCKFLTCKEAIVKQVI